MGASSGQVLKYDGANWLRQTMKPAWAAAL